MILTCPECATSYFVDEARIPPEGRTVKCSSCGARWRATADAPPADDPLEALEAEAEDVSVNTDAPVAAAADDYEIVAEPAQPAEEPSDAAPRRRPAPGRRPPAAAKRGGAGPIWIGLAAAVVLAAGAAVVLRHQIVRAVPASQGVFAAVGLPVKPPGLVIEQVKYQAGYQGGRPVLSVTGAIRNVGREPLAAPPLRLSLVDKAGKPLGAKLARPLNADVPPGAVRYFAVALHDPPAGADDLQVGFEPADPAPAAGDHG